MNADDRFEQMSQEMLNRFMEKNPDFATFLGLHDPYDYILPEGSAGRLFDNLRLLEEWIQRLNETVKKEELNEENQTDWEVLEKTLEMDRFSLQERRTYELDPDAVDMIGGLVFIMFTRDYTSLEKRVDAIAARIEKVPKYLAEFRSRFEKSRPVRLWTEIAIEKAENFGGLFQFIIEATRGKVPDRVHGRLVKAVENVQPAFETHMKWLKGLTQKTEEEWALGKEKFEKLIRLRELGMTSTEIYELGVKYLRELKTEREKLAQKISPGKTAEEVLKMIESKAPKTFEEALKFTKETMEEARQFVQEKNIATVYPEDILLVEETPAFLTPIIPFAALMGAAKFDKPQIGIYIVTKPRDPANMGKHLSYSSIRNTAVHEAFPGHFLQTSISNRGSFVRLLAEGTETVEGWAHYCEEMMAEKGFITDLESRLIQINDMIWRAVRIIVDVKLSRGEMEFKEAVELLVKETGMSREAALAEVKRYTQTPSYALSYLLGKHLILELKKELQQTMGQRFDERFFHDTITANGYLPVSMLRKVFKQKIESLNASS